MNALTIFCVFLPLICAHGEIDLDRVIFPQDSNVAPLMMQVNQNAEFTKTPIQRSSEKFSLDLFFAIANSIHTKDANFVISPFSIWSLLILVAEGASDESFAQLARVLNLPDDMNHLRPPYKNLERLLMVNTSSVEVTSNQALFSDRNSLLEDNYVHLLRNTYEADQVSVDFQQPFVAAKTINDHINFRTHGKIHDVVAPGDLTNAQLVLASTIYFNGAWKFPFNVRATTNQPFYRENGQFLANVPMMTQTNHFAYASIDYLHASFIELPYGEDARFSMILIRPDSTLTAVFKKLRQIDIAKIHAKMHKNDNDENEEWNRYRLTLPRFSIDYNLELRSTLERLGIADVFDATKANLSKMSKTPVFVSRVNHKAVIQVDEVGTIAAAATTAELQYLSYPQEILIDRPFGFLITDRITHTLLFAGQVRHPLA